MSCFKLELKDLSRYQLQYPLSDPDSRTFIALSDTPLEASYQLVAIQDSDQATFTFKRPFTETPQVVAGLVKLSSLVPIPSVNVYVESVTKEGGIIRTSAPVLVAGVAVHAMYMKP